MWLDNEPELAEAYRLKEDFYSIYDMPKAEATRALDEWIERCKASPVKKDFKEILSALRNWREPILAYFDYPITNGYTEALNGVAKVINRQGRGYTFDVIRVRVLGRLSREKRPPMVERMDFIGSDGWKPEQPKPALERPEGQCESCRGIFDEDDLALYPESPVRLIKVCRQCIMRLHTEDA